MGAEAASPYQAPEVLENDRMRLEKLVVEKHGDKIIEVELQHPALAQFQPRYQYTETRHITEVLDELAGAVTFYAIVVKRGADGGAEELAGTCAFQHPDAKHASSEVGITTFPAWQRTFVTTNAVGLLLHYLLDAPSAGGLGLRRVQWTSHADNAASIAAARRLGFRPEGVKRWGCVLPERKRGNGVDLTELTRRNGGTPQAPGRDSAILALCWDDWLEGEARLDALMARRGP